LHLNHEPGVADWSAWHLPKEEIGAQACQILVDRLQSAPGEEPVKASRTIFMGSFIEGWTT